MKSWPKRWAAALMVSSLVALATTARGADDQRLITLAEDPKLSLYGSILRQYAAGERVLALQRLGDLEWKALDDAWETILYEVMRLPTCAGCTDPFARLPLPAAAMLHLDRQVLETPRHQDVERASPCGGRHQDRALDVARLLTSRAATRSFGRRFLLGVALRAQWDSCLEDAVAVGRIGLELFPGDAELLLAVGASFEKWARLLDAGRDGRLANAARYLAQAVAADPARATTRVHLGRVLWRQGRLDEAQAALEAASGLGDDADPLYLAHTFLGHVHQRAGRSKDAVESFHRALAIAPDGQAAALGLAHALRLQGDTAGAGQFADQVLAARDKPLDPLVNHLADNAAGAEELLDALREETRR